MLLMLKVEAYYPQNKTGALLRLKPHKTLHINIISVVSPTKVQGCRSLAASVPLRGWESEEDGQ